MVADSAATEAALGPPAAAHMDKYHSSDQRGVVEGRKILMCLIGTHWVCFFAESRRQ